MSETRNPIGDDDNILAAEYALGLVDQNERRVLEERIASDDDFADIVEMWELNFAELGEELEEVSPSPDVRVRLLDELFPPPPVRRRPWYMSLALWQGAAASFAAISVVLAGALLLRPAPQAPSQSEFYVAALSAADQPATVIVRIDADARRIIIPPFDVEAGGLVTQLWLIAEGEDPSSLGLINPNTENRLGLSGAMLARLADTTAIAISLEPEGGSPTGLPTGPVIAVGSINPV